MRNKLAKDTGNEMICGVCSGIANYLDLDPTIVRLIWVIFTLAGGSGILAYIACALLMPEDKDVYDYDYDYRGSRY